MSFNRLSREERLIRRAGRSLGRSERLVRERSPDRFGRSHRRPSLFERLASDTTMLFVVGTAFLSGMTLGMVAGLFVAVEHVSDTRHGAAQKAPEKTEKADRPGNRIGLSGLNGFSALTLLTPAASAAEVSGNEHSTRKLMTPDEAVRQAHAVEKPDMAGMIEDASHDKNQHLSGFGGGDLSLVQKEASHWQGGNGVLFGPASGRVVACRGETDPECRAVQVLDKGFSERPAVPDDVLEGRDDVIDNAGDEIPGIGGEEGCTSFVIETKPVEETEVCRAGSPFGELTCRAGWEDSVVSIQTRWACGKTSPIREALVCRVPAHFSTTTEHTERCFFDESALAVAYTSTVTTEAEATAVFPATCRATQMVTEEVGCSKVLEVTGAPSCTIGDVSTSTTAGPPWVFQDSCAGGDTVTIEQTCERVTSDRLRTLKVTLNGWAPRTIRGTNAVTATAQDGVCKATFDVESHSCNGTDCLAKVTVTIRNGGVLQGTITALHPYQGYATSGGLIDSWTDNCQGLEGSE